MRQTSYIYIYINFLFDQMKSFLRMSKNHPNPQLKLLGEVSGYDLYIIL